MPKLSLEERIRRNTKVSDEVYERIRELERCEEETSKAFSKMEAAKFEQFVDIASRAKYFSLDHVDALGLEYDILIFVSEKNIGKTSAIYQKMAQARANGEKSIFLRIQMKEVEAQMNHFNTDELSPFYTAKNGSMFYFFDKKDYEAAVELETEIEGGRIHKIRYSNALKLGLEPWGFATYFRACNTTAGGSYEGYKYIFIDEFITWSNFKVFDKGTFENWTAFPSSIARNKKNLKIYMFGNLKSANNDLLAFYGIKDSDKLRYIRRGFSLCEKHKAKYGYVWGRLCDSCSDCDPPCRIMYINADCIYRGVKRQSSIVKQARPKELAITLSNKVVSSSDLIISPDLFEEFIPVHYVGLRTTTNEGHLLEIRKAKIAMEHTNAPKTALAVKVVPLEAHFVFDMPIKTSSQILRSKFRNLTKVYTIDPILKDLWLYQAKGELYFYDDFSLDRVTLLINEFAKDNNLPR